MGASVKASLTTDESRARNSAAQRPKPTIAPRVSSPVDQISLLQRTVGNRGVERLLRFGLIQAKLKVNEPGDSYEQEADRISGQVLATPAQHTASSAAPIQRVAGQPANETLTAPPSVEQAVANSGKPLDAALRREMEPRFGCDFSQVRVHLGSAAERSARDINARAYTLGDRMVFGAGEFNPATNAGRRLLAHELTHVVQQAGAAANVVRRSNGFDDEPTLVEGSSSRGQPRGHVERGGEKRPGNIASGEIDTGGGGGKSGGGGGKSGGGGGGTSGGSSGGVTSKLEGKATAGKSGSVTATATKSATKTTGTATGAASKTLVKAEQAAIKAETKLGSRLARGAGRFGLGALLPGPQDAIMLMADFAGSYQEAWDIIEQSNTRRGIAMGLSAGMIGLDWGWVQGNLWRRFATPDVATQVIAAVGKAERSCDDGLVRGHKYGAGHSRGMKNQILGEAFTILAQEGYMTDEERLFTIDTVARVARVLMPLADDFLRQAAERKEAREKREAEQRLKETKAWGSVGFKN